MKNVRRALSYLVRTRFKMGDVAYARSPVAESLGSQDDIPSAEVNYLIQRPISSPSFPPDYQIDFLIVIGCRENMFELFAK